jgi:ribose 5-phosphate isomerase B
VEDDEMNVISFGARVIGSSLAHDPVFAVLSAQYTREERHVRRLAKVTDLKEKVEFKTKKYGNRHEWMEV